MDERTPRRSKVDDVPIIGDYSDAQSARLSPDVPGVPNRANTPYGEDDPDAPEAPPPPAARRAQSRVPDDQWKLDPRDVRRHAALVSQRRPRAPFKIRRYVSLAVVVAVGFLVYWNFETLRGVASGLTGSSSRDVAASGGAPPLLAPEPETVPVETPVVATADAPAVVEAPAASEQVPAEQQVPVEEQVPVAVESPPAPPPEPETFVFSRPVNNVSEGDAAAAVIVQRRGGTLGASAITWWTSDGTAVASLDYADFGVVVDRFTAGQRTHTIRIPIVGDRAVEPPESFYVHLAPGERADSSNEVRTEVVINSDD